MYPFWLKGRDSLNRGTAQATRCLGHFRPNRKSSLSGLLQWVGDLCPRGSSRAVIRLVELPWRLRGGGCEGISLAFERYLHAWLGLSGRLGLHCGQAAHNRPNAGLRLAVGLPSDRGDGRLEEVEKLFRPSGNCETLRRIPKVDSEWKIMVFQE